MMLVADGLEVRVGVPAVPDVLEPHEPAEHEKSHTADCESDDNPESLDVLALRETNVAVCADDGDTTEERDDAHCVPQGAAVMASAGWSGELEDSHDPEYEFGDAGVDFVVDGCAHVLPFRLHEA